MKKQEIIFNENPLFDSYYEREQNELEVKKFFSGLIKKENKLCLPRFRPADLQDAVESYGWSFITSSGITTLESFGIDISDIVNVKNEKELILWEIEKALQWFLIKMNSENSYCKNIHIWRLKKNEERFVKLLLRNFEQFLLEKFFTKSKKTKIEKNEFEEIYGHECIY